MLSDLNNTPYKSIDAFDIRKDGKVLTFGFWADGHEVSNVLPSGPHSKSYKSPAPGQPPTWIVEGGWDVLCSDGAVRTFPFAVSAAVYASEPFVTDTIPI